MYDFLVVELSCFVLGHSAFRLGAERPLGDVCVERIQLELNPYIPRLDFVFCIVGIAYIVISHAVGRIVYFLHLQSPYCDTLKYIIARQIYHEVFFF